MVQLASDGPYRRAAPGEGIEGVSGTYVNSQLEELWECQEQITHTIGSHEPLRLTEIGEHVLMTGSLLVEVPRRGATTQSLPRTWMSPADEMVHVRLPQEAAGLIKTLGSRHLSPRQVRAMVSYLDRFGPPAPSPTNDHPEES